MKWNGLTFRCRRFAASQKTRRRLISGSASPSWRSSGFRSSSLGAAASTTELTWMLGSKNISTEGGPERKLYGP